MLSYSVKKIIFEEMMILSLISTYQLMEIVGICENLISPIKNFS
jgi:hypothetical protein